MVGGVGDMCICLNTHMVILVVAEDMCKYLGIRMIGAKAAEVEGNTSEIQDCVQDNRFSRNGI